MFIVSTIEKGPQERHFLRKVECGWLDKDLWTDKKTSSRLFDISMKSEFELV